MKYTVLVEVPHVCFPQDGFGSLAIYFAYVEADDLAKAIMAGRREAWMRRGGKERGAFKRWKCAYVLQGHAKLDHIAPWTR